MEELRTERAELADPLIQTPDDPVIRAPEESEAPAAEAQGLAAVAPSGQESCSACGGSAPAHPGGTLPTYVYALGHIEARFPTLGVEKEFVQLTGRTDTAGLTDRETLREVLSRPEHRYLTRQLCWVFTVAGLETYVLHPRDPADLALLVEAVRSNPDPGDVDVVIGLRGPTVPPEACNGLMVPVVAFDQIYSFDRKTLIGSLPCPDDTDADRFRATADQLFDRVIQLADNAGSTDEHRAINYLAVRYPAIYARTTEAFGNKQSLTGVEVRPSRLAGTRAIVNVVFSYTSRETDVTEKYFVRVDVTEEFPFLVTRLQPFYDR